MSTYEDWLIDMTISYTHDSFVLQKLERKKERKKNKQKKTKKNEYVCSSNLDIKFLMWLCQQHREYTVKRESQSILHLLDILCPPLRTDIWVFGG